MPERDERRYKPSQDANQHVGHRRKRSQPTFRFPMIVIEMIRHEMEIDELHPVTVPPQHGRCLAGDGNELQAG